VTPHPRDWFRGSLIVASRDLRANARGLKVWIMCALALLLVVGGALGISGLTAQGPPITSQYVVWAAPYYTANGSTGNVLTWVTDYAGVPHAGETVLLGNFSQGVQGAPFVEHARATTNATGWAVFPGVRNGSWVALVTVGVVNITRVADVHAPPASNWTVEVRNFDLLGDGAYRDVSVLATWKDGTPVAGADVAINGTSLGTTDSRGFFHARLSDGTWGLTVAGRGETYAQTILVKTSPYAILPLFRGPDALLLFLGVSLMSIFYPIIAIAMSYDAVAKERVQGSLELLLVRPASRTGVAIGKFLGSFLSVALPMLGVLVGSIVGIAVIEGQWPDAVFATAFVVGTLGLIAIYVLVMQIFSTLARSAGTTILAAIGVWLVFSFLWSLVILAVQTAFRIETATPGYYTLATLSALFNPNQLYTLTVTTFMPASLVGLFGLSGGGSLPDWTGPVAMLVWILALLVIAVTVFRKRIV
jgi:ABC-type transport system involved in multi-copper enzyme maturation permease subunit